jgi:hypothetical protein
MLRGLAALAFALAIQDAPAPGADKSTLHEDLATSAAAVGEQLIKLKSWDEARAFLELIRAKSNARAEALDRVLAKTEKQTSGLKWDAKSSDLIKAFGADQAKKFQAFAAACKETDAQASRWTQAEGEILDNLLDYVKAYARLTQIRAHYELPKTRFDWKLSVPAVWHAEYKRLNPSDGKEIDGNPGYSSEGKRAGERSITSRGESLTDHLEAILHGPFHRTMILSPFLDFTGFGQSSGAKPGSVIDVFSGLKPPQGQTVPLAIPCHNSTNVPPSAFDDNLAVIKDRSMKDMGYPISLTFYDATAHPKGVKARLLKSLKEIECFLSTPEEPALPKRYPNNRNSILLIPKARLEDNSEYNVKISYTLNDKSSSYEWSFRTGR